MPPKAKKVATAKGDEAEQLILSYLRKQNRPYSAVDVFNNLHGAVGKSNVPKILNTLAERNEITAKQFNKTIVYVANQDDLPTPSPEELDRMDKEINSLKEDVMKLKEETAGLQSTFNTLKNALTDEEIEARLAELAEENAKYDARLQKLREGGRVISVEDKKRIEQDFEKMRKAWVTRKRKCKEILDTMLEHNPMKPSQFMEELGIETDEQFGLDPNKLLDDL
ncbi:Tat binding protein 1-interacting protein-domain-containing protein [Paraphysoderma sedebokerense]|nr:Tat binding protein 1-interacting protein-domain-containing protein [Paraphysoderma sedebokerense]